VPGKREESQHYHRRGDSEGNPGQAVAILNGVVYPQGFILPGFKMYFVKPKGDEKVQEKHLNEG
jgi:hypothetical protein